MGGKRVGIVTLTAKPLPHPLAKSVELFLPPGAAALSSAKLPIASLRDSQLGKQGRHPIADAFDGAVAARGGFTGSLRRERTTAARPGSIGIARESAVAHTVSVMVLELSALAMSDSLPQSALLSKELKQFVRADRS